MLVVWVFVSVLISLMFTIGFALFYEGYYLAVVLFIPPIIILGVMNGQEPFLDAIKQSRQMRGSVK